MANAKNKTKKSKYYILLHAEIYPPNLLSLLHQLEKIKEDKDDVSIDFIVNSPGGYGTVAFQMARVLREKCSELTSIVPFYAKSAATLLILASDVIVMNSQSELGPLDTQIEHPNEGRTISAIDHVRSLEYLGSFAMDLAFKIGAKARREIQLSRLDSIKVGLQFAQEYTRPLVAQLDPSLLNQSQRGLKEAEIYSIELMKDYMFNNNQDGEEKAQDIASQLVWKYNTHGFVIDFHEAKRLGLTVMSDNEYQYKELTSFLVHKLLLEDDDTICLWNESEFMELEKALQSSKKGEKTNDKETTENNTNS